MCPNTSRDRATLALGKHCISAKENRPLPSPALRQFSWTTEGAPSNRKAKWFVSLWLVSLDNRVFIHHPHFWWRIIVFYLPTKVQFSFQSLRHSLKIWYRAVDTPFSPGPEEASSTLTWPPVVHGPCSAPHCCFKKPSLRKQGWTWTWGGL